MDTPLYFRYMGTPLYEMALELAEQFTDDFQTQEEFIEGVLTAYTVVADAKLKAAQPPTH